MSMLEPTKPRYFGLKTTGTGTPSKDVTVPRLGMADDARKRSLDLLTRVLNNEFLLYAKLRNAHWSVQSPAFKDLHETFQTIYEHVDGVFDEVAVSGYVG